ncbi:hypothetical protein IMSAGC002_00661 [Lachnospiraceae bacterium]|nr:hypothetical protein IMSAGC002_00661 [Lachnospiraceae bacterium]
MRRDKGGRYSGIGGQAVLEGVMMKNKDEYAVAVRKPDGDIDVEVDVYKGVMDGSALKKMPFIRGVFNFLDSMILGMRTLNHSVSFYEDEEATETATDKVFQKLFKEKAENVMMGIVTALSIVLAVAIFMVLPYYITSLFEEYIRNVSVMTIIEGLIRILIFVGYIVAIAMMKDIKRLYQYHGAEHKCINCIEKGRPLTVHNAMRSSRLHKRCGTSFMFFVVFVSIIVFFFICVEQPALRVLLRIALIPVIAGISYEIIRLAGRSDNFFVNLLSAPGMLLQRLTTKEPDEEMIQVAIASVEAIFDWKAYLKDTFGYEIDDSWLVDGPLEEEEGENEEEPVSVSKQENAQTDDRVKADMDRKGTKSNLQVADADRNVIRKDIPAAGAANGEAWTDGISDGNRALEIVAEVPEKETVKKETSEKAAEAEDRTDEL